MKPSMERAGLSRREFLGSAAGGLALLNLMPAKFAQRPGNARSCIFIFLEGGPSQIDLYDPKPKLRELHGTRAPESLRGSLLQRDSAVLIGSPRTFAKHGQCGMELSDLLPHLATCVDDIALIRSMHTDAFNHHPARLLMTSGSMEAGRPTLGAWLAEGLDTEAACVALASGREPGGSASSWSGGLLPPHSELRGLKGESTRTLEAYGVDRAESDFGAFSRDCLTARRLVERGARFVSLHHASWDHHTDLDAGLARNCAMADRPIAALLTDLKQRGLLDSTLVVCAGEFGRAPLGEHAGGRDHHPHAFSVWLAGGGVRGGQVVGATDELGFTVVEDPVHVADLHATVLHLFGVDPAGLTLPAKGREFRLAAEGQTVHRLLA
jgi:hypothetical protein